MERLTMSRYVLKRDGREVDAGTERFTALINPAELKRNFSISYSRLGPFRGSKADPKLSAVGNETLSFAIVLDGTGAVAGYKASEDDVRAQLKRLRAVVYTEPGTADEIARVHLAWGSFNFRGRLETMAIACTLFAPDGLPLRAKVDLAFVRATSTKETELAAALSAPEGVSQTRDTAEGDTLSLLCEQIYGSPAYAADVARFNGLASLRDLKPGMALVFPPLAAP
jgi:hypothetical protein